MEHVHLYTYDYSTTRPNKDNHEHKESDNGKTRIQRFDIDNPMTVQLKEDNLDVFSSYQDSSNINKIEK